MKVKLRFSFIFAIQNNLGQSSAGKSKAAPKYNFAYIFLLSSFNMRVPTVFVLIDHCQYTHFVVKEDIFRLQVPERNDHNF